ncbi:MAG: OprO/OprP family phosphate-selective porin [Candidatus Binatia bacterium]|nr:OprO/OprP family phosphate-selective porin [Candidatus Binatia bacterium]
MCVLVFAWIFFLMVGLPSRTSSAEEDLRGRLQALERKRQDYKRLQQQLDELKQELRQRERAAEVSAEQSPPTPSAPKPPAPFELRIGRGTATISGLLQVWGLHSELDPDEFRLRRSEIDLKGSLTDTFGYAVLIDLAKALSENKTIIVGSEKVTLSQPKSDSKILQDLIVILKFIPHYIIEVGQKKIPVSMEGLESSAKLDFAERAIVSGATFQGQRGFGDFREPGV